MMKGGKGNNKIKELMKKMGGNNGNLPGI